MSKIYSFFTNSKTAGLLAAALALLVLLADYYTGPELQFPILYIIPVILASWHAGPALALSLSALMPLFRLYFKYLWASPVFDPHPLLNTAIEISVLVLLAILTEKVARQKRQLAREVQQLTGLLPICAFCKKIRTDDGKWVQIEQYISERSEVEFSHGYCQQCAERHFGEYLRRKRKEG